MAFHADVPRHAPGEGLRGVMLAAMAELFGHEPGVGLVLLGQSLGCLLLRILAPGSCKFGIAFLTMLQVFVIV